MAEVVGDIVPADLLPLDQLPGEVEGQLVPGGAEGEKGGSSTFPPTRCRGGERPGRSRESSSRTIGRRCQPWR